MKKRVAVVKSTFDPEVLRSIELMQAADARSLCKEMIQGTSTREMKKQALLRDIDKAPSSKEISRIMWNVMLAGEGLSSVTSNWGR